MTIELSSLLHQQDPVFYAGDQLHKIKADKVQAALVASGYDAFLFFKAEAVRYITDFYVKGYRPFMEPEYVILVTRGRPPAVGYVSGSDDLRIRLRSDIEDARRLPSLSAWGDTIAQMLADYGLASAAIGTDLMPYMVHESLKRVFPSLQVGDANFLLAELTAIKHPDEITLIREAVRIADVGANAAMAAVGPGVTEHAIAAEAVYAMRKAGSEFEPFIPLVASGCNTSLFERVATEKKIGFGELVILDIGAVYRGYTGDLGRTVICGAPTPEQKAIYKATLLALEEAKKIVRPGVPLRQIDARAREVIADEGWGRYVYKGATGHQLGFGLHGEPLVHERADALVEENMVICLEPRIVLHDRPDAGGVHLEDVVRVTADGAEQLNNTPHDQELMR